MTTHGSISEASHTDSRITPIGKGREGKGIGSGRDIYFQDLHLQRHLGDAVARATAGAVQ